MPRAEMPIEDASVDGTLKGSSRSAVSVALLAAMAFIPIVVAAGFLTDRSAAPVPSDISIVSLRGVLDGSTERPTTPARAGY